MKPDQFLEKVCFQTDSEVWLDLDKAMGYRKQWPSFMKVNTTNLAKNIGSIGPYCFQEELRTLQENPRQLKFATMNGLFRIFNIKFFLCCHP